MPLVEQTTDRSSGYYHHQTRMVGIPDLTCSVKKRATEWPSILRRHDVRFPAIASSLTAKNFLSAFAFVQKTTPNLWKIYGHFLRDTIPGGGRCTIFPSRFRPMGSGLQNNQRCDSAPRARGFATNMPITIPGDQTLQIPRAVIEDRDLSIPSVGVAKARVE